MSLVIIAALVAALLVWRILWSRVVAPHVEGEASFSKTSIVHGASFELTITIRNPARLPAPLVSCEFELPKGLSSAPYDERHPSSSSSTNLISMSISMRAREVVHLRYTLYGIRRGQHKLSNCTLTMSNGFTTQQIYKKVYMEDSIVVHPKKTDISLGNRAVSRVGSLPAMRKLYPTSLDWIDMRPYQAGDSIRDVSWLTSGRRGELIVLERATSVTHHVVVVASVQVAKEFWTPDERIAEAVIETAHAVLLEGLRQGAMCTLYTNMARRRSGTVGGRQLMSAQGPLHPQLEFRLGHTLGALPIHALVGLARVLAEVRINTHEPCRMIVITGYEDEEIRLELGRLRKSGHQVELIPIRPAENPAGERQVAGE